MYTVTREQAAHAMATGKWLTHITKGSIYKILYVSKYKDRGEWVEVLSYQDNQGEIFNRQLSDLGGYALID